MSKGIWWIVGVIVVLLVAWFVFGSYLGGMDSNNEDLAWLDGETSYELGDVGYSGGIITKILALKNVSNEAVTIENIFSNCGCTTAEIIYESNTIGPFGMLEYGDSNTVGKLDWSILPGDEFTARIMFDPATHGEASIGDSVERKVTIQTGRGNGEITFTAHIV